MPKLNQESSLVISYSNSIEIFPPEFFDNLTAINKQMEPLMESIRKMNESTLFVIQKSFEDIDKNIGQIFAVQMKLVNFANIFIRPSFPPSQIVDVEPTEITPSLLPTSRVLAIVGKFENFNIGISIEGKFYYGEKQIIGLTLGSNHGKFLKMLLESDFNYVSDEYALSILNPSDKEKGIGFIRDDLIKVLRNKNTLNVQLFRDRKQGYRLISIQPLTN